MAGSTLQEKAYDLMKEKIESGEFDLGIIYSETKMAKSFGFSRTPFRNALIRLSQDRLIDILPSRGFTLHELTEEDARNTYQIRMAIEGFCAAQLQEDRESQKARETFSSLEEVLEQMRARVLSQDRIEKILESDLEFHRILVHSSGNRELTELYDQLTYRLRTMAADSLSIPGRPFDALGEHEAVFRSLHQEDGTAVYQAVLTHLKNSRDIGIELLSQRNERKV